MTTGDATSGSSRMEDGVRVAGQRGDGSRSIDLELRGVTKDFGSIRALDDVSITFKGGEIHGLCGHNGAGKSTLMKVIMGLVSPDSGEIVLDRDLVRLRNAEAAHRAGLSIVDQELGLVPALSVEENLFLGNVGEPLVIRPRKRRARARQLLAAVGLDDVDARASLGSLLPGERKLVELAHVVGQEARLMILDEPTASLSYEEARRVFAAAKRVVADGGAVIFVSHRLDEVFEICDQVSVLRDGRLVETRPVEQFDRATLVDMMVGEVAGSDQYVVAKRPGPAIKIHDLRVPPRVERIDLELPAGSIVGIAGQVGSGASDILRGIAGLEDHTSGTLVVGDQQVSLRGPARMGRRGIHYVTNDRKAEGLFFGHSIESNLTATRLPSLARLGVLSPRARRRVAGGLADKIAVRSSGLSQGVGELSGGNQQKVLIGRCLERAGSALLLLDDPTRGVDVGGRAEIHGLIRQAAEAGHAVLFVSTELDELFDLADVIVTILHGRIVASAVREDVSPRQVLAEMTHAVEETQA
jgi:ABC-type sugar transport system ATPase subunit